MNKYEKALEFLCDHAMYYHDDYDWDGKLCGEYLPIKDSELERYKRPLQELVDKATPKKPKGVSLTHNGRVGNCPFCNKLVVEFDNKPNICECGQRLDWNREE